MHKYIYMYILRIYIYIYILELRSNGKLYASPYVWPVWNGVNVAVASIRVVWNDNRKNCVCIYIYYKSSGLATSMRIRN